MKQLIVLVTFLVFAGTTAIQAQNDSVNIQTDKELIKGLRKGTKEKMGSTQIMIGPETAFYNEKGEKVTQEEAMPLMMSGNYTFDPYVDKNGEFAALVIRKATEEEKEEMKKMMQGGPDKRGLIGKTAPSFSVVDINGKSYTLDELKGSVVVLNFWFIQCKPCIMEIPELNELVEKYKDKDVVFLGLATDKKEPLKTFLEKKPFHYNIVSESMAVIKTFGVNSYPTHVVIGKDTTISHLISGLGPTTVDDLEREINIQLEK